MRRALPPIVVVLALAAVTVSVAAPLGYYRQPALRGDTLVFVAEGDLWKVPASGGVATRLTSHPGDESDPQISSDGGTVAFTARYEGPTELYTMPLAGGLPTRRTWGADGVRVSGWTPDGRILYATQSGSTLPRWRLVRLAIDDGRWSGTPSPVPLAEAADGAYGPDGKTLYFTRLPFQGSHTKRYRGGTAEQIWRFADGDAEAAPMTAEYPGASKRPMVWNGRVYFASDRDGTMNLWSMDPSGGDLRQHTHHEGWDVADPSADGGRVVYQLGADLRLYDIAAGEDRRLDITLDSDLDQTREQWIDDPIDSLSAVHVSPDGQRAVLTARGRVFVAPRHQGRFVDVDPRSGIRYRDARFLPDGKRLLAMSDESGEVELWTLPANGVGERERWTDDGDVLRQQAVPSPDGRFVAHADKNQRLFVLDTESRENRLVQSSEIGPYGDLAWSPDGRWLAFVAPAANQFSRIWLYDTSERATWPLTSDRYDSYAPAWSPDGQWLYLLSDRNLMSIVGAPWGSYQPEPYLDRTTRIYLLALKPDRRSPFAPEDELHAAADGKDDEKGEDAGKGKGHPDKQEKPSVEIVTDGIVERLVDVPVPPGNYGSLAVNGEALFWLARDAGSRDRRLMGMPIKPRDAEPKTVVDGVRGFELSADGKTLLVRKGKELHLLEAKPAPAKLDETRVDLSGWALSVRPRDAWRQMFDEAWRLERDYFYDRGMHGVDWQAMRDKYRPLVDRVTARAELSDLVAQLVSELSALHIFVRGGDLRSGPDSIAPAYLGARLERDEAADGYRVAHVYRTDPDRPDRRSPLAAPGVDVADGDVIRRINGVDVLSVADIGVLLRRQAGRQVLVSVAPAGGKAARDVIVVPIDRGADDDLRYHEWEYTRRLEVEERGEGRIGYVHLRAMGGDNFSEWAEGFYPVFTREGLIVDARNNRGGNIDSWILSRLLRRAWHGWSQRVGNSPTWNMQYAFRGHVVVLCDAYTASDGEVFTEGIRRLDIGTIIGTRTWGGEIWLTSSNFLADGGIATAAEFGVYGPEGEWLIEGHGVEPDIVVDNLPHETWNGRDAQLERAVAFLREKIAAEPIEPLEPPGYPDKSFDYGAGR